MNPFIFLKELKKNFFSQFQINKQRLEVIYKLQEFEENVLKTQK